ncbi:MAG: AAA family ATPase [Terriglobales bacterium]|jgi:predicted kinase
MIVLMAGLPGTGKTKLARELAHRTQGALLSKDEIRAALFAPTGLAPNIDYSVKQDDFVMEVMLEAARYVLQETPARKIFLDGRTFSRRYQIDRVLKFADELSQPWTIIECVCSDETARRRLDLEPDSSHPAHNRTFALYLEVKARCEPITYPKTTISTDQEPKQCVEQALVAINTP